MKQFVVIGCGRFGKSLALKLSELNQEVLVIDQDEDVVNEISPSVTYAVTADVTAEGVLEDLGVQNFDVVIIGMSSNFEASVLVTATAKELGVDTVIAKVKDTLHGKIMTKIGADKVIIPEKETGLRLAHSLTKKSIIDFIEVSEEFSLMEIKAPKNWTNKMIKDLEIRNKYNLSIIAVRRNEDIIINPEADLVIGSSDVLSVVGKTSDIEELVNITND
ncbi:potassium channel family protein [Miniphocaeibacter halophilus]|uniref:TrkA family potassium uptake protein n=1 Tax=Miniphocaeibacter halophilus TaxID=2931922 RepID=A0AC61MPM0_9FIRM|nr:TrkA family potassium uptake protein [Miniphocaeibacter halophilus]QQK07520.1 TrkA family potassium uptake protein [Miniphocaeibacter halophilus]